MVILSLTEKGGETKQLQFDKAEVGVGRVQGNDIVLPKGNVSKRHCRIVLQDGRFSIEDLKSTNGTYVNGRKVAEVTEVFGGDKIYIGDFVIRIENAPTAEAANLGTEAGSLSTALGNRRPPPPPPGRPTSSLPTQSEEGSRPPLPPPPPGRRDTMVPQQSAEAPVFAPLAPAPAVVSPPTVLDLDDSEPLATAPPRAPTPPPAPSPPVQPSFGAPALQAPFGAPALQAPFAAPALQPPVLQPPVLQPVSAPPAKAQAPASQSPIQPPAPVAAPPVYAEAPEGDDDLRERALSDAITATKKRGAVAPNRFDNPANPAAWISQVLSDASVAGVYVMGPEAVELERNGKREAVSLGQAESKALALTIRTLAERAGVSVEPGVVDVAVEGGARLVAIFPPYARSVCASLTRGVMTETDLGSLQSAGCMSADVKSVLQAALASRCNILVSGDRLPALSLLRALARELDPHSTVISVGELVASNDPEKPWVTLATEPRNPDLIHAVAHLHPEYVFADVSAAAVAADILHECTFGQQGAVVLAPGRSARDALARLEAGTGSSFRAASATKLIATAFDLVVHCVPLQSGWRISTLAEPTVTQDGRIDATELIAFEPKGTGGAYKSGSTSSRLAMTLEARGKPVPNDVLRR